MKKIQKKHLVVFLLLAILAAAVPSLAADKKAAEEKAAAGDKTKQNELVSQGWMERCMEPPAGTKAGKKVCAIYDRIDMKDPPLRISEFAVGYDPDKDKKDTSAIGKIILPLGILLENGVVMKVDDAKSLSFKPSFCTNEGCVSVISLPKDVIEAMTRAKVVSFLFKSADGRDVKLDMSLTGFEKALKGLT